MATLLAGGLFATRVRRGAAGGVRTLKVWRVETPVFWRVLLPAMEGPFRILSEVQLIGSEWAEMDGLDVVGWSEVCGGGVV